jgi:hypothetical protein
MLRTDPSNPRSERAPQWEPCPRCGALLRGGREGCFQLFAELAALEYSDPALGAVNLLAVDAHALQHPEDHGKKNNAFHLVRLCWILEHNGDAALGGGPRWLQVRFDGNPALPGLTPPEARGTVTVADVVTARTPEEQAEQVWRWARSVWQAWDAYHGWARDWVERNRLG